MPLLNERIKKERKGSLLDFLSDSIGYHGTSWTNELLSGASSFDVVVSPTVGTNKKDDEEKINLSSYNFTEN